MNKDRWMHLQDGDVESVSLLLFLSNNCSSEDAVGMELIYFAFHKSAEHVGEE